MNPKDVIFIYYFFKGLYTILEGTQQITWNKFRIGGALQVGL